MFDTNARVIDVDINDILPNRFQPRIQFDEEEILELSDSIKEHGVIQPIVVRSIGNKYEIIAGERRYKASVLAGKETVPVIVKNLNDKDSAEIALIENVQRKNLTPIEEALSYKKILDMGYVTQESLATKLGKSQSAIANKIRLLKLSDEVQEALLENKISERHARSLLKLETSKQQNEMLNRIINERLTVKRTDEEINKLKNSSESDEQGDSDSQKIIEKGEVNMNNNMFGIPNIPEQPPTSFDIFKTGNEQPVTPQNQQIEPQVQAQNFNIFGENAPVMPENQMTNIQSIPPVPTQTTNETVVDSNLNTNNGSVELPQFIQPTINNNNFNNSMAESSQNSFVSQPSFVEPITQPQNEVISQFEQPTEPQEEHNQNIINDNTSQILNANNTEFIQPSEENIPPMPDFSNINNTNSVTEQNVPVTTPIIESPTVNEHQGMNQQSDNLFSFGNSQSDLELNTQQDTSSVPEFKMPEPIIVTDYSKQYDPVMPQNTSVAPRVEFKEVINAIRECSNKIEQYGFKIDVEEYDLANLYQVIFKIEK